MGSRSTDALCTRPRPTAHEALRRGQRITWARVMRLHRFEEIDDTCSAHARLNAATARRSSSKVKVWGALNAADRSWVGSHTHSS